MTELEKETIVACVGAAATGIPAMLLFWWTWLRDQERLKVQKIIDYRPTRDGTQVVAKDDNGAPFLGILIRNRSLFPVRISAAGFNVDGKVIKLESLGLPLRLKKNPGPTSNRPNIPDDSDPSEIRTGESLRIDIRGQADRRAVSIAINEACQRRNISTEDLVGGRRVAALVALETGRQFTSMPFRKRIWRSVSEPLSYTKSGLKTIALPLLFLLMGMILGGGSVEYGHRHFDARSKAAFEQRARCKSLADWYARANTNDTQAAILERVDFSPSRNSCFAEVHLGYADDMRGWELVDLLSGTETLIGLCNESRDCGNGKDIKMEKDLDAEFEHAIEGTPSQK